MVASEKFSLSSWYTLARCLKEVISIGWATILFK